MGASGIGESEAGNPSGWELAGDWGDLTGLRDRGDSPPEGERECVSFAGFAALSLWIRRSQIFLFDFMVSTANFIPGRMSVIASKSGCAKMFMKPICELASLTVFPRSGGPPKRADGIPTSFSISP